MRHNIISASLAIGLAFGTATTSIADDIVLDNLFSSLQEVTDSGDADRIVTEIWARWTNHPTDVALTDRLIRGTAMMNQGDFVHAEVIFTDIITEDPTYAEAWNKRATLFYAQGKHAQSRADIAQTLSLEPRHFGALDGMSRILISYKKYYQAFEVFEEMMSLMPNDVSLHMKMDRLNKLIFDDA